MHKYNLICVLHSAQSVRHHDHVESPSLDQFINRRLHHKF
jgi:hypothetical protein